MQTPSRREHFAAQLFTDVQAPSTCAINSSPNPIALGFIGMRRICVFSGSSPGHRPGYREAAATLGGLFAREGIGLVYGGAAVGLMATVADAARTAGGEVIGVIPQSLIEREVAHTGLDDFRVVGSMHERKALMAELSDAFVALPGGTPASRSSTRIAASMATRGKKS
jgi:predicted Rossmann-fold nucleotide-binding protein